MKMLNLLFVRALPLLFAAKALGQSETFKVDPKASVITFDLGASLHSVHGAFHVDSGSISFDSGASKISGSIVVAAGTGDSGDESRDKKMKKDVLDVPHFADITFVPRSYQGTISPSGDSVIEVTGAFTLRGAPHDLTVPMQIHMEGPRCTAKTHFAVPYVKWGLKDPSTFVLRVAKEVNVDLTLIGDLSH